MRPGRGHVIIINNMRFTSGENRDGSKHDADNLEDLFDALNFTKTIRNNRSAAVSALSGGYLFNCDSKVSTRVTI